MVDDAVQEIQVERASFWQPRSAATARLLLVVVTAICLIPFAGKPFNIDDPLFVWAAKHIAHHPLDPYGFPVIWYISATPMSAVTKNPPLASYYMALIGPWTRWSEVPLHLAFLLPTIVVILATYELARSLTSRPLLAALLTLAAPGFLVSATSVMCDVPMLALWLLSILAWRRGLASNRAPYLILGSLLIGVCALTKYFGACLLPLLLLYSLFKRRTLGTYALYLLLPAGILVGYELWTRALYGEGLLFGALQYAQGMHSKNSSSLWGSLLVGLSFTGGCMLPVLLMAPLLFRKIWLVGGLALASLASVALAWYWLDNANQIANRNWEIASLTVVICGGIFVLVLAASDAWHRLDAESVLLSAWVLGTFIFAALLNWTVNARSVLPLIPAAAILIARRLDKLEGSRLVGRWVVAVPLAVSLAVSVWLASSDVSLANSARQAASLIHAKTVSDSGKVFFAGHWGFQYYMEAQGAHPADLKRLDEIKFSDIVVLPGNNTNRFVFPQEVIDSSESIEIDINHWISPQRQEMGAGFYSSDIGPLPFAIGRVPRESYELLHLKMPSPEP
jgi:hypothetical protein